MKKVRRVVILAAPPLLFLFWFLTAPTCMAVQRIAAGGGRGSLAVFIIRAADWYEAPMGLLVNLPRVKAAHDSLADTWCEILSAPETTP